MREIRCSVSIYHAGHLDRAEFLRALEALGYDLVSTNTETNPDLHVELSGEMPESDFGDQTLQQALVGLAEKFGVDLLGVLYDQTDQEQYPFVGGKDGDTRRYLESEYVVQAAMKAVSDLGRQWPPSLSLAIHKLLEGNPLQAVLYQSGGTNEGLEADAPIQLLVIDEKDAYAELFAADGRDQESVAEAFDEFSQHY